MSSLITDTPVFVETLAAAAGCTLPDAEEHFLAIAAADGDDTMLVQEFIEQYGTPDAKGPDPVADTPAG